MNFFGKTHKLVRHPDTSIDFYKNMWDTLLQGKEWKGEIKNLTKKMVILTGYMQ